MATNKRPAKKVGKTKDLKPRKATAGAVKGGVVINVKEALKKLPNPN